MIGRNTTNQSQIGKEKSAVGQWGSFLESPEKTVVKLLSACFEKLIFLLVLNIRKTKKTANFEGLEPRRCEDNKAIIILVPEKFRDISVKVILKTQTQTLFHVL